jgi:hypothetical protein
MIIQTLCKITDRSDKRKDFEANEGGKKHMSTADVFFGHQMWKC